MDDADDGQHIGADGNKRCRERSLVGNVAGVGMGHDARCGEAGQDGVGTRGGGPTAGEERQAADAEGREPAGGFEPKSGETACDDVGAFVPRRPIRYGGQLKAFGLWRQHDLADVPGGLHQAEGVGRLAETEQAVRQRTERALGHQVLDLGKHATGDVGPLHRKLVGVDGEIRDVVAERAQPQRRVAIEVALAEFEEPAERAEHADTAFHGFARQGIEDDIDPLPFRDRHDVIGEGEAAGVEHVINAEQAQDGAFGRRPGGGEDFRTAVAGVLDGGKADATSAAMNQHTLAGLEVGEGAEGVANGKKGNRDGGAGGEAHMVGQAHHRLGGSKNVGGQRGGGDGADAIAHRDAGDAGSNGGDGARAFEAEGGTGKAAHEGFVGEQAKGPHDVAEVEAGSGNLDCDLVGARGHGGDTFPVQGVEQAAAPNHEAGWRARHGPGHREAAAKAGHAADGAEGDFALVVRGGEFGCNHNCGGVGRKCGWYGEEGGTKVRGLVGHDAGNAAERSGRRAAVGGNDMKAQAGRFGQGSGAVGEQSPGLRERAGDGVEQHHDVAVERGGGA